MIAITSRLGGTGTGSPNTVRSPATNRGPRLFLPAAAWRVVERPRQQTGSAQLHAHTTRPFLALGVGRRDRTGLRRMRAAQRLEPSRSAGRVAAVGRWYGGGRPDRRRGCSPCSADRCDGSCRSIHGWRFASALRITPDIGRSAEADALVPASFLRIVAPCERCAQDKADDTGHQRNRDRHLFVVRLGNEKDAPSGYAADEPPDADQSGTRAARRPPATRKRTSDESGVAREHRGGPSGIFAEVEEDRARRPDPESP